MTLWISYIFGLGGLLSLSDGRSTPLNPEPISIAQFHVLTDIKMRYAITKVEAKMRNPNLDGDPQEAFFDMYIPKEAFVSHFSMLVKNQSYIAKVQEKEEAQSTYNASESNSGLVQSQKQGEKSNHITFSAKVDPQDKVMFFLTYEEQLVRENGLNVHELFFNFEENQPVEDFKITVNINETLPIKAESIKAQRESNDIIEDIEADITFEPQSIPKEAKIVYENININSDPNSKDGGVWNFRLEYAVEYKDGNEIQIGAGRFVHYFSPELLPTMTKHVIFVIDESGSMSGRKMKQTKDAMLMIVEELNEQDSFDILTFSDETYLWNPMDIPNNIPQCNRVYVRRERRVKECLIDSAQAAIFDLHTRGGTNINDAMVEAVEMANRIKESAIYADVQEIMIIFLTDGEATSGPTTNREQIKRNVKNKNNKYNTRIYGLAFGSGADYDLIKGISEDSNAFAKRIYESGSSYQQLENFYQEISDPKLKNLHFKYIADGQEIPASKLTKNDFGNAYGSNEFVIAGEFGNNNNITEFQIQILGEDANGAYEKIISISDPCYPVAMPRNSLARISNETEYDDDSIVDMYSNRMLYPMPCLPQPPVYEESWQKSEAEEFMEKLWAYKRVHLLLDPKECGQYLDEPTYSQEPIDDYIEDAEENENCTKKAIELAKEYNFVTKVTSLVVESNNEYIKNSTINRDAPSSGSIGPRYTSRSFNPVYQSAPMGRNFTPMVYKSSGGGKARGYGSSRGRSGGSSRRRSGYSAMGGARKSSANIPQFDLQHSMSNVNSMSISNSQSHNILYDDIDYYSALDYDYNPRLPPVTNPPTTTTTRPPCTFGKLTMYEKTYFRGQPIVIESDHIQDFASFPNLIDDKLASINVEGDCCWRIFEGKNFSGINMWLFPREYNSATDIKSIYKKASSAKMFQC